MVIFLCVTSALFALLALHPFVIYPLSLKLINRLSRVRRQPAPPMHAAHPAQAPLRFAVCLCAYNEEAVIEQKMKNLLLLREREPDLEILVYVDAASDRTAELLRGYADRIFLHVSDGRHGKTHGMNLLVKQATAPIVIFTDANVMLDGDILHNLRVHFAAPDIGCVCGNLIYTNEDASVTAASGSLYWRLEQGLKKLEEATGSVMAADGSLFAIRRELHRPPPDDLIDDMYVSFMILCEGYRVVQADDVKAYEASVTVAREEFRRKARIACQAFNVHRLLWPRIRKLDALSIYKYVSHKLTRWFTIYWLALSAVFLLAAVLAAGLPWLAALMVGAGAVMLLLGQRAVRPFSQVLDMLVALGGVGLGVWQSFRGRRYQTWTPAASVRRA